MSTPATGYPDYQNLPQWRGSPLVVGNKTITSASPFHVESWVTNWQAMNLVAILQGNAGVTLQLTYYNDASKSVQVDFYDWIIGVTGGRLAVCLPNVSNYVALDVITSEAAGHITTLACIPVNVPVAKPAYQVNFNTVNQQQIAIPANNFQSFILPYVVEGDGYYYVEQLAGVTGFDVSIDHLLENGNLAFHIADNVGGTTVKTGTFVSTSQSMQITVTNHDAAARNFNIYCTAISR